MLEILTNIPHKVYMDLNGYDAGVSVSFMQSYKWTSKLTWTNSLQAQVQVFNMFKSYDKIQLQQYMPFFGPNSKQVQTF